ncbi:MAG: IPT/TIG domain-containing protein, partial [Acidimicrobiales bacterium]
MLDARRGHPEAGFGLVEVIVAFTVLLAVVVPVSYLLDNILGQAATARNHVQALSIAEKWLEKLNSTGPPAFSTPNRLPNVGNDIYEGQKLATTKQQRYTVSGTTKYYTVAKFTWQTITDKPNLCLSATVPQILDLTVKTSYLGGSVTDSTELDYPPDGLPTYGFLGVQLEGSPTSATDPTPPQAKNGQRYKGLNGRIATAPVTVTSVTNPSTIHTSTAGPDGCAFFELPVGTYKVKAGNYKILTTFVTTGSLGATTITYAPRVQVSLSKVTVAGPFLYDEGAYIDVDYADSTVTDGSLICPDDGEFQCLATGQGTTGGTTAATNVLSGTKWKSKDLPSTDGIEKIESSACTSSLCVAVGFGAAGAAAITDSTSSSVGTWAAASPPSTFGVTILHQVRCPSSTACLAIGTTATGAVILGIAASKDGSGDITLNWSKDTPPSGVTLTSLSALTCAGTAACFVTGATSAGPVLLAGAASGSAETWVQDIPTTPPSTGPKYGTLSQLKCVKSSACFVVATASTAPVVLAGGISPSQEAWSKDTLPGTVSSISQVTCASSTACFAIGVSASKPVVLAGAVSPSAENWVSDTLPATMKSGSQITCAPTACFVIGTDGSGDGIFAGPASSSTSSWTKDSVPGGLQLTHINCTGTTECIVTGVNTTVQSAIVLVGAVSSTAETFTTANFPTPVTAVTASAIKPSGGSSTARTSRQAVLTSAVVAGSNATKSPSTARKPKLGNLVDTITRGMGAGTPHRAFLAANPQAPPPSITSFTPTTGSISGTTTVTIKGTNLNGASAVKFGTTTAKSYTDTSSTTIKAVTKPHAQGTVKIKVTTTRGTAASSSDFKFVPPVPTITSFSPATGSTLGTATVTITGTGFSGTGFSATSVKFGTTTAKSYSVTSSTTIKAVTKAHAPGTVVLKVTTAGGTATAGSDYKFKAPVPTITTFNPATGTTSGTSSVTITGTGFSGTGFSATAVTFGTVAAKSYTVTSSTTIRAVTPPHVAGTVKITVTTAGGTATSSADYKYKASTPTISSFTPTTGTTSGTATVTITGTNLYGATAVKFGTTTAKSYTVTSPTTVKAVTKTHAPGTVKVKVTTAGGTVTAGSDYKFKAPVPTITSFTPTTGTTSGTTTVAITGTGFSGTGFSATAVTFGTSPAKSYTVTSSTTIKAVTSPHVAATVKITVTTAGGTATSSADYKFKASTPTIISFTPATGTTSGTTTVTITGTNLYGATAVKFGTTTAKSYTVTSPTTVKAVTKPHVAGTVKVKVTTAGGTATSTGNFKFVASTPTITSFTPATGTTSGTTTVTITGTSLYGATAVKFGTTTAKSYTVTSPTTIKAVTKTHVPGTATLKVTTAGGTATAGSDYKFKAPTPTITSFTPATGTTSGTTTVTITGTGFSGTGFSATAVTFGTVAAKSYTVTSSTTIRAVTPPHVAGTVKITVTTVGGTAISSTDYKYKAPTPSITSFIPVTGTTSGTTTVTITGIGLYGATSVKFGTTTAKSYTVTNPTTVKAVTKTHAPGTVTVKVTTAGGTATAGSDYKFKAPVPTITSFTPTTGTTSGTTTMTITGTGFSGSGFSATAVKVGTAAAKSYTVTSSTTIKAVTQAHVAGTVKITVTTVGGTATSASDYTYVAHTPTIASFSPATGTTSGTTTVTITGTNLYGATAVKFGTTTAKSYTVTSPTTIKAVTKTHAPGTVTVKVTTDGGTATSGSNFKFVAPVPTITSFTPTTGTTSGTSTVTITGTGFNGTGFSATAVKFGTTTAKSYTVTSSTIIKAVTKPHVAATVKVKVTTAGGTATSAGNYKFVAPVPTITSFTPATGTTSGTTTVTITGTGFYGATAVKFGTTTAKSYTVTSPTTIKAVTKTHAPGTVTVKVISVGGTGTVASDFKFVAPAPTITSFTPTTGTTSGTITVTIIGTGFSGTGFSAASVKFGTTTAKSFTVTSSTTIRAVTKPHVADTVTLRVTTVGGTATAGSDFKFVAHTPTITSFTPTTGTTSGTTSVTITGTNLYAATSVKFGTTTAKSYTVTSPTTIKAVTKPHVAATVKVKVTTAGGSATSTGNYKFVAHAPTVTSFTPTTGPTSGTTTVTITGTNLYGATSVKFGTTTANSFTVTSPTTIKAVTKTHAPGTVTVKVTTVGGTATAGSDFKFKAPVPTITSFTPATGSTSGTTTVTITGTGFSGTGFSATAVTFGTVAAKSYTVTSSTTIKAVTKPHVAGTVKITVTTAGGTATSPSDYKYVAPTPIISSFTPVTGSTSGTTTVTITGAGLYGATTVRFGTTTAKSFTVTSPTTIKAVTKTHLAGTVTVKVTTAGGTATAASDFRFVAPVPTITSFTPATGTTSGTATVTITGTGFIGATSVKFGTTTAKSFAVTSPTTIKAVTKPHVAGTVKVKVTTAGGTATSAGSYKFVAPVPTITSFTPATGTTSGTTTVTITGTGFIGATSVKFGTTTAKSFTVTSPTTIRAVTKTHAPGTVKVKVTTTGGTATSTGYYKFIAPAPTVTSFTPTTGTTSGTTTVTITGTSFYNVSAVKFGTTTAKSFTVTSPTTIKAVTKSHVPGTVTVKVTTATGTATAGSDFKFVAPVPTITSFTPATGTTSGTTTVTITGTGFIGATSVKFGTTTAKSFTVTSPTTIKAVTKTHAPGTVTVKVTTAGGTATAGSDFKFV